VAGADRLTYLHALATQAFDRLAPGKATEALILSPQGHIEHAFAGVDDGTAFLAYTQAGAGRALADFLDSMRFMLRVEVTVVTELAVVHEAGGGGDGQLLGRELLVPRAELTSYASEHPSAPSGTWALEALRIASGRPRVGVDSDHKSIPNELGLLGSAVHLDKGCYRGQETVARVHTLGRPPRRLTLLHLDGSADRLPLPAAEVTAEGRRVGFVGSSARHHELGPIALALVKRNVPVDVTLLADGVAAAQQPVVDPDIGLHVRPALR
ncbi:MAG: YgfZ/GcvT domain-containing protein, partial [Nocardioidaceae bacterium]